MAWIDWRGEHTTQLCLADGCVHETAEIDEQGVRVPGAGLALELAAPVELRSGAIGKTALSVLPEKLRAAFPGGILALDERKWRSRGSLRVGDHPPVPGWAIHERVSWP